MTVEQICDQKNSTNWRLKAPRTLVDKINEINQNYDNTEWFSDKNYK